MRLEVATNDRELRRPAEQDRAAAEVGARGQRQYGNEFISFLVLAGASHTCDLDSRKRLPQ